MSTLSNVRDLAATETSSLSLGRIAALVAGAVSFSVEALMSRADLSRSRRQLAELDDRLLRDIGIDRAKARFEADKGFWA
jgi:uncharacterized protein YjiS (DUF1127 family)